MERNEETQGPAWGIQGMRCVPQQVKPNKPIGCIQRTWAQLKLGLDIERTVQSFGGHWACNSNSMGGGGGLIKMIGRGQDWIQLYLTLHAAFGPPRKSQMGAFLFGGSLFSIVAEKFVWKKQGQKETFLVMSGNCPKFQLENMQNGKKKTQKMPKITHFQF